jgi:serine/threonine protein kinase
MSDTIVCTDTHLERQVVIKSLKPGADTKRILDELAALQTIRSKHVVQIYDVIRDEKGAVVGIVEEYLPGDDLTSVKAPQNSDEFLWLAYPIAEGIADIHAHNRVHRDIKRQNMKFDAEGCLKIFDFGLARDTAAEVSTMGEIGTPGYMAPELFAATKCAKVVFDTPVEPSKRLTADKLVEACEKFCYPITDREFGVVSKFDNNAWGFIQPEQGKSIFFHVDSIFGRARLKVGDRVSFARHAGGGSDRAFPVIKIT